MEFIPNKYYRTKNRAKAKYIGKLDRKDWPYVFEQAPIQPISSGTVDGYIECYDEDGCGHSHPDIVSEWKKEIQKLYTFPAWEFSKESDSVDEINKIINKINELIDAVHEWRNK